MSAQWAQPHEGMGSQGDGVRGKGRGIKRGKEKEDWRIGIHIGALLVILEKKMETTISMLGSYWGTGKENKYNSILGLYLHCLTYSASVGVQVFHFFSFQDHVWQHDSKFALTLTHTIGIQVYK